MLTILAKMAKILPSGCFPTMITPMHDDKSIDFARVKILTEWYIQVGLTPWAQ
jgi:4-hydroxy-tetrahydrodipicolinate synthase